jgi:hypothetical protein
MNRIGKRHEGTVEGEEECCPEPLLNVSLQKECVRVFPYHDRHNDEQPEIFRNAPHWHKYW